MKKYKNFKPLKAKKEKYDKNALTDNVRANEMFSPFYFLIIVSILYFNFNMSFINNFFSSAVFYAFISTLIYVFASNYFQPDLDVMRNRPGMGHFPLGRWVGSFKFGRILKLLFYPINRAWYWLWHPYAQLLTHRGAGHWIIWGVWLRIGYLMFWYYICEFILIKISLFDPSIRIVLVWLKSFFPWDENFGSFYFLLFCFPIYLSDTVHIGVDFYDAVKRSISFCPPKIPRGLIIKTINTIKGEV